MRTREKPVTALELGLEPFAQGLWVPFDHFCFPWKSRLVFTWLFVFVNSEVLKARVAKE